MRVVYFQRKPYSSGHYSLESYFAGVRARLPPDITAEVAVSRFESRGLLRRTYDTIRAPSRAGDVNHITGDVHFLAALLPHRSTILTIHDCGILHHAKGLKREVLRKLWFQLPVHRVAAVTVVSEATKKDLLAAVDCDPSKIRVIPTFVSQALRPMPKPFNAERPTFLQIGTATNKNLRRVAQALSGISCRLEIIGTLDQQQRIELRDAGVDFHATGRLSDAEVRNRYEACDALIFASTDEGFGMPIIEANVVGRPVITSNTSSMPEVASDAALLVDPLSTSSIRGGVLRIMSDAALRERLVANGFKNRERFDSFAIAGQYVSLYRELFAESTTSATRHSSRGA